MTKAEIQTLVRQTARDYGLDEQIALAQIQQESNFNPNATGPQTRYGRAKGLAQFIDPTAREYGVDDPYDPEQAIDGWARYMTDLLNQFGWDRYDLALAAYNGGPANVKKFGGIPPFQETQNYVRIILANAKKWPVTESVDSPDSSGQNSASTSQPPPGAPGAPNNPKPTDNSGTIGLLILAVLIGLAISR